VHELERLTRRFAKMIAPILGGKRDIPAPDMNTNEQTMAWFMDEISARQGFYSPEITTVPIILGGSEAYWGDRARLAIATVEVLRKLGRSQKARAIRFRQRASYAASILTSEYGC
jgi:glutamate dehydrogenase/leucine dehydrogenase